jgi:hypothetical protein
MTIEFESESDVIVYALEKIISYARKNQYIFVAQSVWWISSIIGLQEELVSYIDKLQLTIVGKVAPEKESTISLVHPDRVANIQDSEDSYLTSDGDSISTTESTIHNEIIDNCELFLEQSQQERKAIGRVTRQASRVVKRKFNKKKPIKSFGTQTEGIDGSELRRRKAAGECQRCAWPRDRKGSHKTLDCFRWKRVEKGTAPFPKRKKGKGQIQ